MNQERKMINSIDKHYEYYELYQIKEDGDIIHKDSLKILTKNNTFNDLYDIYASILEQGYTSIYDLEIKNYLREKFPEVYNIFKAKNKDIDITDYNIEISLISKNKYKQFDINFNNECELIDDIIYDKINIDKNINITEEILSKNGCERHDEEWERKVMSDEFYITDYSSWGKCTINEDSKNNVLNIDFQKGNTNNGAIWHIHIDNNVCMTIGSADISTIWQFNTLMEVFGSKFRLNNC